MRTILTGILPEFMFTEKSQPVLDSLNKVRAQIEIYSKELKRENSMEPAQMYESCIKKIYENGLSAEALKKLFVKIIIYEPNEITEKDMKDYNIPEEQYNELLNQGGYLFIQRSPWNSIILDKQRL